MAIDLLKKYQQRLEFRDLAYGTYYRYMRVVSMYLKHSKGELSRETVESFITLHRETSGTYRRFLMVVLKGLFEVAEVAWPFAPRELPKLSTPYRPFFTVEDVHRLLDMAKKSPLDHALIRVAASTGCRREELARMKLEDFTPPVLTIKTAKGGAERVRTLNAETVESLNTYLQVRCSQSSTLFVSEQGMPLSAAMIGDRFRKLRNAAGFKQGIGMHALRRGTVTRLYQAGLGIVELQSLLGWRSSTMPSVYVQLVPSEVDTQALKLDTLDKPLSRKEHP